MITKKQAENSRQGQIFHHVSQKNADKTPIRCRVMGVCKIWKTRPEDFKLPVKYGMYDSFYITPENAGDWI